VNTSASSAHTVPYGTDRFLDTFQAINCLATFIQSLRDNKPSLSNLSTPHHPKIFEHEDDDEHEHDDDAG